MINGPSTLPGPTAHVWYGPGHDPATSPHSPSPNAPSERLAGLVAEARHLARRRLAAENIAARCRLGGRPLAPPVAETIARRATRRAIVLRSRFHRTLDALMNADAFEDALRLFRERNDRDRWPQGRD
jgi:hypothetical protein